MDFRWKNRGGNLPNVQPNFVDPQGVRATIAQQQMAGYQPNPQVNAPNPQGPSRSPVQPTSGEGYQFDSSGIDQFNAKKEKLATLKGQLATIDGKLAELKATAPDDEKAIAAKLMEIGDTSLYQGILARQQNQAAQNQAGAAGIDNMLFDAEKLTWGLKSKNAEDREMVRSNIEATLRRAEDAARKQGVDLSKNESYQRLRSAMDEGDKASIVYEGEEKFANTLWSKSQAGNLRDADIEKAKEWVESHPDSQFASKVIAVIDNYMPKTTESKAKASKRKADALDLYYSLNGLDPEAAAKRIANLTPRERKLLEDFYPEMLK